MGSRLFIFEDGGAIRHIPQRVSNGIAVGSALLLEYAGRKVRYALVYLETDNRRRPVAIQQVEAGYFSFDERGNAQPALAQGAIRASETWRGLKKERERTGSVVGISARIARKKMGTRKPLVAYTGRHCSDTRGHLAKES